jgi:hypothetical protein
MLPVQLIPDVMQVDDSSNRIEPILAVGLQCPAGADVACVVALLQELFDHARRIAETGGDLIACSLLSVVDVENVFAQINR